MEAVPQVGAARVVVSEEEWKERVVDWISTSKAIVMYAGKTNWVNWELERVIEMKKVQNMILIMPEIKAWRGATLVREVGQRWNRIKEAFKDTEWGKVLMSIPIDPRRVRAMVFCEGGTVISIISLTRFRDSYHLAALVAHYILLMSSQEMKLVNLESSAH
jgi:hypothetical protein